MWGIHLLWLGETSKEVSVYLCAETPRISDFVLTKYPGFVGQERLRRRFLSVFVSGPVGLGLYPDHKRRVPHISLVSREMWDSTNVSL
jgi:hypothetical protein